MASGLSLVETKVERGRVMRDIRACRRCPLAPFSDHSDAVSVARAPVPFRGPTPSRVMILGEAPGYQEDIEGVPFIGPAGQLLERLLAEAGLPPTQSMLVANAVCCRSQGPPDVDYVRACSGHLRDQVRVADPEWVLSLGAVALSATQTTFERISAVHGRPIRVDAGPLIGRWLFPTFHPSAALRDDTGKMRRDIAVDLSTFRDLLDGRLDAHEHGFRLGRKGKLYSLTTSGVLK